MHMAQIEVFHFWCATLNN